MMKAVSIFIGGIVACFVAVKAAGMGAPIEGEESNEVLIAQIDALKAKSDKLEKELNSLKSQKKGMKITNPIPTASNAMSVEEIKNLVKAEVAKLKVEGSNVTVQSAVEAELERREKVDEVEREERREKQRQEGQKRMVAWAKRSIFKDVELSDSQSEEVDTVFNSYMDTLNQSREDIYGELNDDATSEDRDAANERFKQAEKDLRDSTDEQVKSILNDDEKYTKYKSSVDSLRKRMDQWGGGDWGRRRGGRGR